MYFITLILFCSAMWSCYGEQVNLYTTNGRWHWKSFGKRNDGEYRIGSWVQRSADTPYEICSLGAKREPSVWLRSDHISTRDANMMEVSITYRLNHCKPEHRHCKNKLYLYVRQSNESPDIDPREKGNFQMIRSPLPATGGNYKTVKLSITRNKAAKVMYLAFHDRGACVLLKSVQVSYNKCGVLAKGGMILFPETIAPASKSQQIIQREGRCKDKNSVNKTSLIGQCLSLGKWQVSSSAKCFCRPGYAFKEGKCEDCPAGTYKDKAANTMCRACPKNSKPGCLRDECVCKTGYYRVPVDQNETPCEALPPSPKINVTTVISSTAALISWFPAPRATRYSVECAMCSKAFTGYCYSCRRNVKFFPSKDSIAGTSVTISGLKPSTFFKFKVFSRNQVNEVVSKRKWNYLSVNLKTKSSIKSFCKGRINGNYPHPEKCSQFIMCSNGITFLRKCGKPLYYNPLYDICDWMRNVDCKTRGGYNYDESF